MKVLGQHNFWICQIPSKFGINCLLNSHRKWFSNNVKGTYPVFVMKISLNKILLFNLIPSRWVGKFDWFHLIGRGGWINTVPIKRARGLVGKTILQEFLTIMLCLGRVHVSSVFFEPFFPTWWEFSGWIFLVNYLGSWVKMMFFVLDQHVLYHTTSQHFCQVGSTLGQDPF